MSGAGQDQKHGQRRVRYTLSPLASPAALLGVFMAVDDLAVGRNPAGAVLQLVRCTRAVGEAPGLLGVASGPGAARPCIRWSMDHFVSPQWGEGWARRAAPPPAV